ncbi:fibronectin type III domain-containing protein [Oxalobacteraceae bacterium A2-2]
MYTEAQTPLHHSTSRSILPLFAGILLATSLQAQAAPARLSSYNTDPAQNSVSGLSSGGFMAAQVHVAFSSTFKAGAGIVAGGPFYCAQGSIGNALSVCMAASAYSKPPTSSLISTTDSWAAAGQIDATSNLAASRVYLYSGSIDSTVKQPVMDEAKAYYQHYVNAANIYYKNNIASEHGMVTDDYGNSCSTKGSPYINNCNFDLAGEMLKWIYGSLQPRNSGALGGSFIEYDQSEFISDPASHGMASSGWAYVPASCSAGQSCRVHLVLHGCQQDTTKIGDQYYRRTGYNRWADTNNIIVLYPQTAPSSSGNPNGCWDWWGYDDANYAKKSGRQMAAIKGMVDRVNGGHVSLPAPTGLQVTGVTNNAVALAWAAVSGASGYDVYRGGAKANSAPVTGNAYTDGGLASGTTYSYTVKALTASGAASAASAPVSATTSGSPPPITAPTGVQVSAATASSVTLAWTSVPGASGYNVYRNGARVTASPVAATGYTDQGLAASSSYTYTVTAYANGNESAPSAPVTANTQSAYTCSATTASNYAHVTAGRAVNSMGYALAKGSNQNMGLNNLFYSTTLAQTAPGYYVIGNCP